MGAIYTNVIIRNPADRNKSWEGRFLVNTGAAQHYFCGACGVKSFYVPRSFPEGYSVNLNCLDRTHVKSVTVEKFDGDNWEAAYDRKKHAPAG